MTGKLEDPDGVMPIDDYVIDYTDPLSKVNVLRNQRFIDPLQREPGQRRQRNTQVDPKKVWDDMMNRERGNPFGFPPPGQTRHWEPVPPHIDDTPRIRKLRVMAERGGTQGERDAAQYLLDRLLEKEKATTP
jgi:hypothetical protein